MRCSADIGVIGGGASGLMAAVASAGQGARTIILERMDRVGKKLLATGNGRCNLTDLNMSPDHYHGENPDFVKPAMDQFGLKETLTFFESIGLEWRADETGRVFPVTDQASTVLDLLRFEADRLNVREICQAEIYQIRKSKDGFHLRTKDGQSFDVAQIILASGGRATPNLGSNGSGFVLAQELGHALIEPFPAIVQILLKGPFLKKLKGIKVNAAVALMDAEKRIDSAGGEVLFTEYGMSGLPVLHLSRHVRRLIQDGDHPFLELDLYPERNEAVLSEYLTKRFQRLQYKSLGDACVGLFHKRLIPVLLTLAEMDVNGPSGSIGSGDVIRLTRLLKRWNIAITGTQSWSEAQVTAGGIRTDEVNPETLESKIVPGLFFAGEILDIDGDCGGYNLQWAWSSGFVAGTKASDFRTK